MSRRIGSASPAVVLQAEKDIKSRLRGQHFDFTAMSAVSNVYRAGTAVRNHMERTVLAEYDLSWSPSRSLDSVDLGYQETGTWPTRPASPKGLSPA